MFLSPVHRRWVRLGTTGRGTTWTSGRFSVGDLCGSERRPSASVTNPPMHFCQWRGSSTDGRSTVRGKFTPWQTPASTACGRPWRASSWSPARSPRAAGTTVTSTQSSELHFSHFSLPTVPSVYHRSPISVPNNTCYNLSNLSLPSTLTFIFPGDFAKVFTWNRLQWLQMINPYLSFTCFRKHYLNPPRSISYPQNFNRIIVYLNRDKKTQKYENRTKTNLCEALRPLSCYLLLETCHQKTQRNSEGRRVLQISRIKSSSECCVL